MGEHAFVLWPGHTNRARSQIFSHYNYITRFVKCQERLTNFFFASNFEPHACTAIDTVSNFHISWSWKLGGSCQIFKLMGAATLVKFSYVETASPRQILYVTRSCNSCIFARPPIKLEHKPTAKT